MKLRWLPLLLAGLLCVGLLVGCGQDVADTSAPSAPPVTTTSTVAEESADDASDTAEPPAEDDPSAPDTPAVPSADSPAVTDPTVVRPTVTDPVVTTTTTSATTTTTTTTTTAAPDPNRAMVNGQEYAVGDTLSYTVMVKTAENYGTAKIGVRYRQKGLDVPSGTFQKQNQYVMKNLGVGLWGTMPEDTVGNNGFTMTSNKGYQLDTTAGYAGLLWFYETTNYDYTAQSYREIDCSGGVALFTIVLKITKPGEYVVDCMEYATQPRTDLTVWGVFA